MAEPDTGSDAVAFGVRLRCRFALPLDAQTPTGSVVDAVLTDRAVIETALPAVADSLIWEARFAQDTLVRAYSAGTGAYRIDFGDDAAFLVDAAAGHVDIAAVDPDAMAWRRFLLDTVLWWVALMHGRHLLHAGVVARGGDLIAILGNSGAGKTSLALALIAHGARFFSDDLLCVDSQGMAHPGPPLMNVPVDRLDGVAGSSLQTFQDGDEHEVWTAVEAAETAPRRLTHVVFLERDDTRTTTIAALELTALDLLPHVWALPDQPPTTAERFRILSDLATEVRAYHVVAGAGAGPSVIADLIETALDAQD